MTKKKKKKRVFKIKNILILITIILLISGIIYYLLTMPVKNIYIQGNQIVPDDEIMKESNLYEYPSFLLTKNSSIKEKLLQNKYIKDVKVTKKIGNIIELTIAEYHPIAITTEEKLILEQGLEIDNTYTLTDLPILINKIEDKKIYKNFTVKFSQIKPDILRQISQIEYSPVNVDEERFLLYMNDGNLVYITLTKINKLNKYNNIKDKLNNQLGTIYLDAGDYVELKQTSPPNIAPENPE